jgi:hypothetical protein
MWVVIWRNMLGKLSTLEYATEAEAKQVLGAVINGGMIGVYQKIDF